MTKTLLCALAIAASAFGQSLTDLGPHNLAHGTSNPATCNVGDIFFRSDLPAGQNLVFCGATNTWTIMSAGTTVYKAHVAVSGGNLVVTNTNGTAFTAGSTALAASTVQNLNIITKPANTAWTMLAIYTTQAFAGTSITQLLVGSQVVNNAGKTVIIMPQSFDLTVANNTGNFINVGGSNIVDLASFVIPLNFTATGANMSALTAGAFDIYLVQVPLP